MYFYGLNIAAPGVGPSWTQEPLFEQTWYRTTRHAMLHTKVQATEPSGSEEEIFEYFLCISMIRT